MKSHQKIEDFFIQSLRFADHIEKKEDELIAILTTYETYDTARDELQRSTHTLRGFKEEFSNIANPLSGLNFSTFFPLNLPVYSLVIFGIAPSAFAKDVFIRPPEVMHEVLQKVWNVLEVERYFPELSLKPTPRNIFMELYASESEVILFTGKYENALKIHKQCPESLLIYNGSGINPFIVFDDADLDLAAKKAVEMRCFNSGQDCAGPDAFFVASDVIHEFIEKVKHELASIKVGDTTNYKNRVGRTIKSSYIGELQQWIKTHSQHIVYGGKIDSEHGFVHPTIIRESVANNKNYDFHEFFAPFFYVLEFRNTLELETLLLSASFKERGMYVSIFGSNKSIEEKLTFVKILKNKIVNDVEIGNEEYGGYGSHANFLLYKTKKTDQPILISRDLHNILSAE